MRSLSDNLMSLEQWADLALIDPFALAGWCVAEGESGCQCERETYFEYQRQGKRLSRQEISQAIMEAERLIAIELGTFVAPRAVVGEIQKYPQPHRNKRSVTTHKRLATPHMVTTDGKRYKSIVAKYGFIQSVGVYVDTSLGETTDIQRNPSTGLFTATLTLPSTPSGSEEYLAYFVESDRIGDSYDKWQVREISTSVNGLTLTITGGSYNLMKPECRLGRKWECQSEGKNANYVSKLLIYQRVIDDTQHGNLQWGENPCLDPVNGCNSTTLKGLCIQRDDHELNPVLRPQPQSYDTDTQLWSSYSLSGTPDFVYLNYISGVPRSPDGRVAQPLAQAVFYLSASLLQSEAAQCGCDDDTAHQRLKSYKDVQKTRLLQTADDPNNTSYYEERVLARAKHLEYKWGGLYGAVKSYEIVKSFKEAIRQY